MNSFNVVAVSPAADAWSFDAFRVAEGKRRKDEVAYGWPLALAGMIVVLTYVISGFAKLRYGGPRWVLGDTLRNHIAYSTARLDLVDATRPPIAKYIVDRAWIFPPIAATAVVLELAAPIAFVLPRYRCSGTQGVAEPSARSTWPTREPRLRVESHEG